MRRLILLAGISLCATSCLQQDGGGEQLSDKSRRDLVQLLTTAGDIASNSDEMDLDEFSQKLRLVQAKHRLLTAHWPSAKFYPESKALLDQAVTGWTLAEGLWSAKESKDWKPAGLPVTHYDEYFSYTHGSVARDSISGQRYILPDRENIAILLELARDQFRSGRMGILPEIKAGQQLQLGDSRD